MNSTTDRKFIQTASVANDQLQASIAWGFTLGFGLLTAAKAVRQTSRIFRRTGPRGNAYVWLVWGLLIANLAGSILVWLRVYGVIERSLTYYFCLLVTWVPQVQFIPQIIINRISLLLYSKREINNLKYGVAFVLTLVNISVFCIWIPARLRVSPRYVQINEIWDRIEKVIFLMVDLLLNGIFVHLVRSRLIEPGLEKYRPVFHFNLFIITISLSMDILLIGLMSLPNHFVYAQFHPLAYTVKLHIEMSMAELIVKIVRTSNRQNRHLNSVDTYREDHTAAESDTVTSPGLKVGNCVFSA